jgi:hypothetical protein
MVRRTQCVLFIRHNPKERLLLLHHHRLA